MTSHAPGGWGGSKCRTYRFGHILTLLPPGASLFHNHMSSLVLHSVNLILFTICQYYLQKILYIQWNEAVDCQIFLPFKSNDHSIIPVQNMYMHILLWLILALCFRKYIFVSECSLHRWRIIWFVQMTEGSMKSLMEYPPVFFVQYWYVCKKIINYLVPYRWHFWLNTKPF